MHTCRFCGEQDTSEMVKYATRHWAHYRCWFTEKAAEIARPVTEKALVDFFAERLHDWQIYRFPVSALSNWLQNKGVNLHGKRPVDMAMDILRAAAERNCHTLSDKAVSSKKKEVPQKEAPRKSWKERALEAEALLRSALPFLDEGHECTVCGNSHDQPHEHDCFVPRLEKVIGEKVGV